MSDRLVEIIETAAEAIEALAERVAEYERGERPGNTDAVLLGAGTIAHHLREVAPDAFALHGEYGE